MLRGTTVEGYYEGSCVYRGDGSLDYILHPEGVVRATGQGLSHEYFLKDHLGNTRVVFGSNGAVLQATDYYAFGMEHTPKAKENENRYLYNGKELQDETFAGGVRLGWYDYGWRFYDPQLGRFHTVDPMAEKYYSISPYAYCANNPIRFVDPTGMIIEDPDELVKKQKAQLNQNLSYIQNALKAEGLSEGITSALNKLAGAFQSSLNEISTLEKSDQVYSVHYGEGKEGGMSYDNKTGAINIGIGKSDASIGLIGHELKHAYQYEKGQISLVTDNSGYGKLYDITDETAAYNRERTFGAGIQFFQTPNAVVNGYPLQMSDNNVRSFGNSMTPPAYQTLPNGPIDINSKEGKALIQQTLEAGRAGTPVKEVYKGWQKDYLKGQKN